MSVRENVQMVLHSYHRTLFSMWRLAKRSYRDEADHQLQLVGMEEQGNRICGVLAYGDLKRVELAMALANRPRLLLMDEPTAGMSPQETANAIALIEKIVRERGLTLLFTEHDMDVVFSIAEKITVLHQGQVLAEGTPAEVRSNPEVQRVYLGETA